MTTQSETKPATAMKHGFDNKKPFTPKKKRADNGALLSGANNFGLPAISIPNMENVEVFRQRREVFKQFAGDALKGLPELKKYVAELRASDGWQDDPNASNEVASAEKQIADIEKVPAVRDQLLYEMIELAKDGDEFISALRFGANVSARGEEWKAGVGIEYPRIKPLPKDEGKDFIDSFKKDGKFDGWRFGQSGVAYRGVVFRYFVPDANYEDSNFQKSLKKLVRQRREEFADKDLSEAQVGDMEEKAKIEGVLKDPRFKAISELRNDYVPGLYIAHSEAHGTRAEGAVVFEVYFHKGRDGRETPFMKPVEFFGSSRNLRVLVGTYLPLNYILKGKIPERMAGNMSDEKFELLGHFANMIHWRFVHANAD